MHVSSPLLFERVVIWIPVHLLRCNPTEAKYLRPARERQQGAGLDPDPLSSMGQVFIGMEIMYNRPDFLVLRNLAMTM
jgi:hypothetical protein